jgi:hypothetical protein
MRKWFPHVLSGGHQTTTPVLSSNAVFCTAASDESKAPCVIELAPKHRDGFPACCACWTL